MRLAREQYACDFDRATFLRSVEQGPERQLPAGVAERANKCERQRDEFWKWLFEHGVARRDVDRALPLEGAWMGLSWAYRGSRAMDLLFKEEVCAPFEDDGCGPIRLLTNGQVHIVLDALAERRVDEFGAHYEVGRVAWSARGCSPKSGEESYEYFAMLIAARQRLVAYLNDAKRYYRALLVWTDV
ncbi:YfbM family protein [Pendulispora rubella]|uniref:YfbM family protein n=1 Tax=Pendulispora rubella TaxID=2741070 RepID=A0ABZ2L7U7_9BACT